MGTIYQCLKRDDRYTPPIMSVMHEASSGREAIAWLEKNGGGIYRNLLHGFDCEVRVTPELSRAAKRSARMTG